MGNVALQVENLGKMYRISVARHAARSPWQAARDLGLAPFGYLRRVTRPATAEETLWALRDINLSVAHGEAVGIIGRNGAGKSTLLKILSHITEPTHGRALLYGRVASLLEVGTGFHPELTGRENVYLNGAILGMSRAEIAAKFDEIIAFAEVERFLDTPVKRYSSGMYVRLAFAVAAHLEPEILLIDEVLAVGDIGFQSKCLGKMNSVAGAGRTVLFISHNMAAIANLCHRVILLDAGNIVYTGDVDSGIKQYMSRSNQNPADQSLAQQIAQLPPDPSLRLHNLSISQEGAPGSVFAGDKPQVITVDYEVLQPVYGLRVGFDLKVAATGLLVFRSFHDDDYRSLEAIAPGHYSSVAILPPNLLTSAAYRLELAVGVHNVRWLIFEQIGLTFEITNIRGTNSLYADSRPGMIMPQVQWTTKRDSASVWANNVRSALRT
jgi:lipopolysaccharide transport system ATP-binding protein